MHIMGPRLPGSVQVFPDQAMLYVLFDYPIHSDRSEFAIHSRLARLAVRVVTTLRFVPPDGATRLYGYQGDPGIFKLDPGWSQAVRLFVPFDHVVSNALPLVVSDALAIQRTPGCACVHVRRAPIVGHVVQT